jgi:polyvinyl alcohol dehydrogenase (cytochrome)
VGSTAIYVPDWKGNLYAINKTSGQAIWSAQISQYAPCPGQRQLAAAPMGFTKHHYQEKKR